jgi:hypothetical protein
MSYEIQGKIIKIFDKQIIGENFEKKEFVVRTNEDYPQDIKIETVQKTISLLDECAEGDDVVVKFNIKGKEYKGNYYNNLSAWKIQKMKDAPEEAPTKKTKEKKFKNPSKQDGDMPF